MHLSFDLPTEISGDQLAAEITQAGFTDVDVYVADGLLFVAADSLDESDSQAVAAVIEAHVPIPPAPPVDRLAQLEAEILDLKQKHAQQIADRDAVDDEIIDWLLSL